MDTLSFAVHTGNEAGLIFDNSAHQFYPTKTYRVINGEGMAIREDCSYYGYVCGGTAKISFGSRPRYTFISGMYFSSVGSFKFEGTTCRSNLVIIEVLPLKHYYHNDFSSFFTVGGPIEGRGRVQTHQGRTESVLIAPITAAAPTLTHHQYGPHIADKARSYDTYRIGVAARGNATICSPFGNYPIESSNVVLIKEAGVNQGFGLDGQSHQIGQHSFQTKDLKFDIVKFKPR